MEEFIKRLRSFKLSTWMMKPKELSPVECAKRGYVNTSKDTITCTHCGAYFNSAIYYEGNILQMHSEYCKLSLPITLSYSECDYFSVSSYTLRLSSFSTIEVLPAIIFPSLLPETAISTLFPTFPKIYLKTIYALFGWTAGFSRVHCELCGIVIECSRKEYALAKSRNYYNVVNEHKPAEKMSLRRGVEISLNKQVDLTSAHRYYCPWVNDLTVSNFSYFTNAPESDNIGWKILAKALTANNNAI
jgi:hypothetical protein